MSTAFIGMVVLAGGGISVVVVNVIVRRKGYAIRGEDRRPLRLGATSP